MTIKFTFPVLPGHEFCTLVFKVKRLNTNEVEVTFVDPHEIETV